ncbi:MAG TPA: DinB family protein [Longimicrobium sp.]|nr:DinB family protein [Longimicrobium sp.]
MSDPEVWLRGPIAGVPPLLMPAAHALAGAGEDVARAAAGLTVEQLWARPAGVASVGFHLRHIPGILDRLLTYARGESLTEAQLAYLRAEPDPGDSAPSVQELLRGVDEAIARAIEQIRATPEDDLLLPRGVGRLQLPSTVMGLIFHAAEHAQRHTGQVVTLSRIVREG